jgi:hypothetical protein
MTNMLPMLDPFEEIKRLYFSTTAQTIERDLARALDLLTRMPTDADRERVAGYMHGLADLRREWKTAPKLATKRAAPKPAGGKLAKNPAAPEGKDGNRGFRRFRRKD